MSGSTVSKVYKNLPVDIFIYDDFDRRRSQKGDPLFILSDLNSGDVFYTDSNGRGLLERTR